MAVGSCTAPLASVAAAGLAVESDVRAQEAPEAPSDALDLTISTARSDDHPTLRVTAYRQPYLTTDSPFPQGNPALL